MRSNRVPFSASVLLALATMTLAGCSRSVAPVTSATPTSDRAAMTALRNDFVDAEGTAQSGTPANLFYPLDLGNHWGYDHEVSVYIVPTGGPPGPVSSVRNRQDRDLVCLEPRFGRRYVVEQTSYGGSLFSWLRYRQDGAGLYEADVSVGEPPVCASVSGHRIFDTDDVPARSSEQAWTALAAKLANPAQQAAYRAAWDRIQARAAAVRRALEPGTQGASGGVESDEITRLEYPLHPGAHWVIRANPHFESIVERAEVLDLAVGHVTAWRIRIENEFLGQDDSIHFWFGRDGFLKSAAHFEGIATDPGGNIIGVVIADESEQLDELSLQGARFAAP